MPAGEHTTITDVLAQMPGVAIDQNQQIHIRNTEGPQFQYQINGALVPLDINTNPPFISMFNSMFVSKLDLLDGVLPSRYSYATGGVVDIQTKEGQCSDPGGSFSILAGQRGTLQPSVQYAGCDGKLSYYVSGLYSQSDTAFSSATPGPNAIHDWTNQGQAFGYFSYPLNDITKLSVIFSSAASNNQLPNVPNLAPQFALAGVPQFQLSGDQFLSELPRRPRDRDPEDDSPSADLSYQIAYAAHWISQDFKPDNAGELIFEGVASTASHNDLDNTLQGDLTYKTGSHTIGTGFYVGEYRVIADDTSLVFPVDANGNQTSTTPITVVNNAHATNMRVGDLHRRSLADQQQAETESRPALGRFDRLHQQQPIRSDDQPVLSRRPRRRRCMPALPATCRCRVSRAFRRPRRRPSPGLRRPGRPGISTPLTEDDFEFDVGVVHHLTPNLTLSQDNFYEITRHYLDTGPVRRRADIRAVQLRSRLYLGQRDGD